MSFSEENAGSHLATPPHQTYTHSEDKTGHTHVRLQPGSCLCVCLFVYVRNTHSLFSASLRCHSILIGGHPSKVPGPSSDWPTDGHYKVVCTFPLKSKQKGTDEKCEASLSLFILLPFVFTPYNLWHTGLHCWPHSTHLCLRVRQRVTWNKVTTTRRPLTRRLFRNSILWDTLYPELLYMVPKPDSLTASELTAGLCVLSHCHLLKIQS